jgi:hypothetical protein
MFHIMGVCTEINTNRKPSDMCISVCMCSRIFLVLVSSSVATAVTADPSVVVVQYQELYSLRHSCGKYLKKWASIRASNERTKQWFALVRLEAEMRFWTTAVLLSQHSMPPAVIVRCQPPVAVTYFGRGHLFRAYSYCRSWIVGINSSRRH